MEKKVHGIEAYPKYPLECLCSHRGEWFQLAFARKALELMPKNDDLAYEPGARGLVILAGTELALERPLALLREVYGDQVRIGNVTVRYHRGRVLEEPYMALRIQCASEHFEKVKSDLGRRGSLIEEAELGRQIGVLRAKAPLAALLGYPRKLVEMTGGRAKVAMWLSHYAPVSTPPAGGAA